MIRRLFVAAVVSLLATVIAALALRAANGVLAVGAVAGVTVFVTWLTAQHGDDEESGLGLANPAWAIGLSIAGRAEYRNLVPVIAVQVVSAVLGGLIALSIQAKLPDSFVWQEPQIVSLSVITLILGIISIWLVFAIDQQVPEPYAAIGPILAGGCLPLGLTSVLNPAVIVGLATAGLVTWQVTAVAAASIIVATIAGALLGPAVSPRE